MKKERKKSQNSSPFIKKRGAIRERCKNAKTRKVSRKKGDIAIQDPWGRNEPWKDNTWRKKKRLGVPGGRKEKSLFGGVREILPGGNQQEKTAKLKLVIGERHQRQQGRNRGHVMS